MFLGFLTTARWSRRATLLFSALATLRAAAFAAAAAAAAALLGAAAHPSRQVSHVPVATPF